MTGLVTKRHVDPDEPKGTHYIVDRVDADILLLENEYFKWLSLGSMIHLVMAICIAICRVQWPLITNKHPNKRQKYYNFISFIQVYFLSVFYKWSFFKYMNIRSRITVKHFRISKGP